MRSVPSATLVFVVVGALESVQGWGVGAWHLCCSRMLVTKWLLRL